jgi:hypothetical protein
MEKKTSSSGLFILVLLVLAGACYFVIEHPAVLHASSLSSVTNLSMFSSASPAASGSSGVSSLASDGNPSIVRAPSVSAAFINRVLSAYHSPAAGTGQALYDEGVKVGIDPAVPLAFFLHESRFGTQGEARSSLSLGNIRCLPSYPCRDGFAWFPSWQAGYAAWYTLIAGPLYVGAHRTSVEQVCALYDSATAPAYAQAVTHAVSVWRAGQVFI